MVASPAARRPRDSSRIGWIDYLLMTACSCLAGYSGGMAINESRISWFVVQLILGGAVVSFLIRSVVKRSSLLRIDGVLYGIFVIAAFALRGLLQSFMPEGGFPIEVAAAGSLSWMLILGSFVTWQDSTLLFQAVPSIAMFGLVGCYDTFRNVIYLFFAFLLCLATLFARAHHRQMLRQAADSGYFTRGLAPGAPIPEVETTPGLALQMREGPWRWVAGPEWALGSALVVVLISLLGAPVVRQSTQGVAGFVRMPTPPVKNRQTQASLFNTAPNGGVRVGTGPNNLTNRPMFEANFDRLRYLRRNTYETYEGGMWRNGYMNTVVNEDPNAYALQEIYQAKNEATFPFKLRFSSKIVPDVLSVPGYVVKWDLTEPARVALDSSYRPINLRTDETGAQYVTGTAVEYLPTATITEAQRNLPPPFQRMLDTGGIPQAVLDLAKSSAGTGTDFQRAQRIQDVIAQRIKYNINAAATPSGSDPVEWTLFESHEAYCDVFASSMVLMARAIGIPARYVTGYLPSPENQDTGGNYVVLESDGHAWAELYFKNVGWVVFDATEGADSVPGGERGRSSDQGPWYQRAWFKSAMDATMVILVGGILLIGLRAFADAQRKRTVRGDLNRVFLRYSRALERFARVRRDPSWTPDEFLSRVAPRLGAAYADAAKVNDGFVRLMYAPGEVTSADVKRMGEEVSLLQARLRSTKPVPEKRS